MKKWTKRAVSLLLAVVLLAGAVPARAGYVQTTTPGDPNPAHNDLAYDEAGKLYFDNVHVAGVKKYEWPVGSAVCVLVAGKYTLSDLNGTTIPAGMLVDVYQASGSQYRFRVRYDTRGGTAITVTNAAEDARNGGTATAGGSGVAGFTDVGAGDYYADAVAWAVEQGVTGGTSASTFSPDDTVTRAQAVTFLWRAAGSPDPASMVSPFEDVADSGSWYYAPVLWAAEEGITGGVSAGRFGPEETLAYDQIFTFLSKAVGESGTGADWSQAAVNWAGESGLTDGLTFTAKGACPRADVVYCLWKQMGNSGETSGEESHTAPSGSGDLAGARAAVEQGLEAMETAIDVSAYGVEAGALLEMAEDVINPEGYADTTFGYYGVTGFWCFEEAGQAARTLWVKYSGVDPDRIQRNRDMTEAIRKAVDQMVEPDMSDYETAKALHDYIVLNSAYGYPPNLPQVVDGGYLILVRGMGVCTDYAMAYKNLMDAVGIPCEVVFGTAGGGGHAWNIIQIGGEWYHVDTTWDDPTPNREGYVRYDYFLKSDAYMSRDHSGWEASHDCTSTKYDNAGL